jgi:hypothetical protein
MARTAVVAGTASAVVGHSQRAQADKAAGQEAQAAQQQQAIVDQAAAQAAAQVAAQQPAAAPAAPAAGGDLISQLKELGDLKAAGVLTDEEFTAAKAQLLA